MKHLLHGLLALLVCVSAVSAQKKSTRERDGVRGPVHAVRLESFVLSKTTGKEELLYGATIDIYDTEGYKTQQDHFSKDGSLSRRILSTYDAKNRLTEEADYLGSGSLRQKTIYTYDNDNKTAQAAFYEPDGSLSLKVVFTLPLDYDLNELTELQAISFWREPAWVEAASYDSSGTLLKKYTAVNKDGRREITHTINDSSEGLRTSEVKTVYIYDANGKMTDHYYLVNGTTINKSDNGGKVEQKYEFDSQGNWTRMVVTSSSETRVEYRTITYY
jgi:hypothetical protein